VIRAGYGLYNDRLPLRAVANALQRDGIQYKLALLTPSTPGAPVFPGVLPAFPTGILTSITSIDPGIRNSYAHQGSLQISRELVSGLVLDAGYMTLRGSGLIMSRNVNVPTTTNPAVPNLGRPDPRFANNSQYQSIGSSWYDGMTVSLHQRTGSWTNFRVSYTLSKALDTSGNFFFSTPQDNFDIAAEKGRSDNDQRHRLTLSGVLTSPVQRKDSGWGALARDWRLSWIFSYTSALPFNLQAGADLNGDSNANDRPPGVGRNTGKGFDYQALDLRLSRSLNFGDRCNAELMVDFFNVLNHTNNMVPNNVFGTGTSPRPTLGQPTAVGDPRQIQLGMRVRF
jgi:hypothetical protein